MTKEELEVLMEVVGTVMREEFAAVEARLDAIEAQPFAYDGPHETGKAYRKGTFVTRGGSLWHCNQPTTATPGDGPSWTLAVKAGRDSR